MKNLPKVSAYIAISIDSYIAREDGTLDFTGRGWCKWRGLAPRVHRNIRKKSQCGISIERCQINIFLYLHGKL